MSTTEQKFITLKPESNHFINDWLHAARTVEPSVHRRISTIFQKKDLPPQVILINTRRFVPTSRVVIAANEGSHWDESTRRHARIYQVSRVLPNGADIRGIVDPNTGNSPSIMTAESEGDERALIKGYHSRHISLRRAWEWETPLYDQYPPIDEEYHIVTADLVGLVIAGGKTSFGNMLDEFSNANWPVGIIVRNHDAVEAKSKN